MPLAKPFREAHWAFAVGDPTVLGWVTAIAYLFAAVACAWCWHRRHCLIDNDNAGRFGVFHLLLALTMLLLAGNKQLDLQGLAHATGRNLAIRQGWFDRRHDAMRLALIVVGVAGVLSVAGVLLLMRGLWKRLWLSVLGVVLLAGFAFVRTGELLGLSQQTERQLLGGVHLSHALELAGIALVLVSALRRNTAGKTRAQPASHGPG
ncbi:MAG: hypothetical protein ACE37H_05555 [Phycisphaeraceae bacterium]